MNISFRQGLVTASANNLDIQNDKVSLVIPPSSRFEASIAHRTANYLITKITSVLDAWTIDPGTTNYLYIDVDRTTAGHTYGVSLLQPVFSPSSPQHQEDLHWFDTASTVTKVSKGGVWVERIRIFVGAVTANQKRSPITWTTTGTFVGTQVGLVQSVITSPIAFDAIGNPVLRSDGTFLTTADTLTSGAAAPVLSLIHI